jgi:hypothetical protein
MKRYHTTAEKYEYALTKPQINEASMATFAVALRRMPPGVEQARLLEITRLRNPDRELCLYVETCLKSLYDDLQKP